MEAKEWLLILKGETNTLQNYDCNVYLSKKQDGTFYYTITELRYNPLYNGYTLIEHNHFLNEGLNLTVKDLKDKRFNVGVINWFKKHLDLK